MPLPPPAPRDLKHTRTIVCQGYEREDGLWDIEARLTDTKPRDIPLASGGVRPDRNLPGLYQAVRPGVV